MPLHLTVKLLTYLDEWIHPLSITSLELLPIVYHK